MESDPLGPAVNLPAPQALRCFAPMKTANRVRTPPQEAPHLPARNVDFPWPQLRHSCGGRQHSTLPRSLLKFSGGHSSFRLLPDRTLRV